MNYKSVLSTVAAAMLVACGGGGGGGGGAPMPSAPAAVQITESNAKPVGAHATATAQDASAAQGSVSLMAGGVQVDAWSAAVPNLRAIATLAQLGARVGSAGAMAAGVSASETCPGGGTLTATTTAAGNGVSAGDSAEIVANNCTIGGETLNGSLSLRVVSGSITDGASTFHIVMSLVADKLSIKTSTQTATTTGDLQLDWNVTSGSTSSMTASGTSLSTSFTTASGTRSTTLRNYSQTIAVNGAVMTGRMSASVESTSTLLGSAGGSYTISTPSDLVWTTTNSNPTAGVIEVVGANRSKLRVTYSGSAVVLAVDADGDGTYEKTINTTASELKSQL